MTKLYNKYNYNVLKKREWITSIKAHTQDTTKQIKAAVKNFKNVSLLRNVGNRIWETEIK